MNTTILQRLTCCTINVARLLVIAVVVVTVITFLATLLIKGSKNTGATFQREEVAGEQQASTQGDKKPEKLNTLLQSEGKLEQLKTKLSTLRARTKSKDDFTHKKVEDMIVVLEGDKTMQLIKTKLQGSSEKMQQQIKSKLWSKEGKEAMGAIIQGGDRESAVKELKKFLLGWIGSILYVSESSDFACIFIIFKVFNDQKLCPQKISMSHKPLSFMYLVFGGRYTESRISTALHYLWR